MPRGGGRFGGNRGSRGRGRGGGGGGKGKANEAEQESFVTRVADLRHGRGVKVRAIALVGEEPGAGLYTGGNDCVVKRWDTATGECKAKFDVGGDVGSMLYAGGWLFVGAEGGIRGWHLGSGTEAFMGTTGKVMCMRALLDQGTLFSGGQDGSVRAWQYDGQSGGFLQAALLEGHRGIVTCLETSGPYLVSAGVDRTIRVWELASGSCVHAVEAHSKGAMGLQLYEGYIISCSLAGDVRVWSGLGQAQVPLQSVYDHPVSHDNTGRHLSALALCGVASNEEPPRPVLALSCKSGDYNCIRCLELPTFEERTRFRCKFEMHALASGPSGLFFAGDHEGLVKVFQWQPASPSPS